LGKINEVIAELGKIREVQNAGDFDSRKIN